MESNDTKISCHKIFLSRCEYFKALYTLGFKDSNQQVTSIEYMSPIGLTKIIEYLYTDQLVLSDADQATEVKKILVKFLKNE